MKLPRLSLPMKIACLVASMGVAGTSLSLYTGWQLQRMQESYQSLLQAQLQASQEMATIRQSFSDASTLVYNTMDGSNQQQTLQLETELQAAQHALAFSLDQLAERTQLPAQNNEQLHKEVRAFFAAGMWSIQTARRYNPEQGFEVLRTSFIPAQHVLRRQLHDLQQHMQLRAQASADAQAQLLTQARQRMLRTSLLGGLSLTLLCALVAWRGLGRPLQRLSNRLQLLRQQCSDNTAAALPGSADTQPLHTMIHTAEAASGMLQRAAQQHDRQQIMEQLQQLTSDLPGAVFQIRMLPGMQLRLHFVSPQWASMLGLPALEDHSPAYAARCMREHAPNAVAIAREHFVRCAQTLESVNYETPIAMLDGVTRWIKTRANPHVESDGSILFNGVWMDVSQEVLQSRALEKAKRHAEQIAHEKSTLQASISHEIRTPLNAILGLAQLLLKAPLPPMQREQADNILRASKHLRGIVNEVLDFSKIDAGQMQLESTDFSLQDVLEDVLRMCREDATRKGLALDCTIAPNVPDQLRGDPHRIAQILLNYVNNAIKFTPQGHIHVQLQLEPGSTLHRIILRASVQDTGPGIPADRIAQLFQAFQQADNSITRRFGGTGLGLTISRELAQLMGGRAGVQSLVGQGSTFWFTAVLEPARTTVVRHAAPPPPAAHWLPWQGLRVLVVDDNPLNRTVAEGMLRAVGLDVDTCEDGLQAVQQLQALPPQHYACVFMDVQMPRMDGLSATQALRQDAAWATLPIIAMTAHTGLQDMAHTRAAGMNDHLAKPLLESALHDCLARHLPTGEAPMLDAVPCPPAAPDAAGADSTEPALPSFDASAVDHLVQLLDATKLQQLLPQFVQDTQARAAQLQTLLAQEDWQGMRSEVHKLAGTAATFGLLHLGQVSQALSSALKNADGAQIAALTAQLQLCSQADTEQLRAYVPHLFAASAA